MTEANQGEGSASPAVSDGANEPVDNSSSAGNQPDPNDGQTKAVPLDVHKKVLNDYHSLKSQVRDQSTRLEQALGTIESLKAQGMREKEDYKGLADSYKAKYEEAEGKVQRMRDGLFQSQRHQAVYPLLKRAGLRDEAEGLIDMYDWSGIEVDLTSSGRFDVQGVEPAIEAFKEKFSYAFERPKAPRVNGSTGGGGIPGDGELTPAKIVQIEDECRKKGDMTAYHAAVRRYQEQRASQGR